MSKHCKSCSIALTPENKAAQRRLCVECLRSEKRTYASNNRDRMNRNAVEWRRRNPTKWKEYVSTYRKVNSDKYVGYVQKRRAQKAEVSSETIDRSVVFDRDNGTCYLCGSQVDPTDWHMDHIHPISKGGSHTYDNVRVTHPECNLRKGVTLVDDSGVEPESSTSN